MHNVGGAGGDRTKSFASAFVAFSTAAMSACAASETSSASADGGTLGTAPALADGAAVETAPDGQGAPDASNGATPVLVFADAALDQSSACTQLRIGIFGNPGANASSSFQVWLTRAGTSVQRIQNTSPTPTVTAATFRPFDIVILDWLTRDYTSSEADAFATWVSAGGGVVSMSGYDDSTTDDWRANSLLAPLRVAYAGPLLDLFVGGAVTDFAVHPITTGLTSVTFAGGFGIADLGGTSSARLHAPT